MSICPTCGGPYHRPTLRDCKACGKSFVAGYNLLRSELPIGQAGWRRADAAYCTEACRTQFKSLERSRRKHDYEGLA